MQEEERWLGGERFRPRPENDEVNLLESHEPYPGLTVRVKEGHWKSKFSGMRGTVEHRWGHPHHPALDVRLEDGRLQLFWFHELEKA